MWTGGRYTKDDFKEYEKERDRPSKLALKEKVKPKQEYPFLVKGIFWTKYSSWKQAEKNYFLKLAKWMFRWCFI